MVTSLAYPDVLAPGLAEVLGQPCFEFIQLSHLWREGGVDIKTRAEDEQAYFIDKQLRLYLQHGDEWRKVFSEEVCTMVDKVKAQREQKGKQNDRV